MAKKEHILSDYAWDKDPKQAKRNEEALKETQKRFKKDGAGKSREEGAMDFVDQFREREEQKKKQANEYVEDKVTKAVNEIYSKIGITRGHMVLDYAFVNNLEDVYKGPDALVELILYLACRGGKDFIELSDIDENRDRKYLKLFEGSYNWGKEKPLASKLETLIEIFNKTCKFNDLLGPYDRHIPGTPRYELVGELTKDVAEFVECHLQKYIKEDRARLLKMKEEFDKAPVVDKKEVEELFKELQK